MQPTIDLVVDTSAIVAVARDEPTALAVRDALGAADGPVISAAAVVELHIVTRARSTPAGTEAVRAILEAADVVTMPVDPTQAELAAIAWDQYGRGNHPAGLNFGDRFSSALARHLDAPLLCVGDDFARTDIRLATTSTWWRSTRPPSAVDLDSRVVGRIGSVGGGGPWGRRLSLRADFGAWW